MTLGRAMLANPILAAIAVIATGAYLIYKNWEPIKEFFAGLWEWIKTTAAAAWEGIKAAAGAAWEWIKTTTAAAWESGILPAMLGPIGIVIRYWDEIKAAAGAAWEWIKTTTAAAWESGILPVILGPIGIVIRYWDEIKAAAGAAWEWIKTTAAAAWESGILPVILGPIGIVVRYWDKIKAAAAGAWEWIVDFFSGDNLGGKMIAAGKALVEALAAGVKAASNAVYEALKWILEPVGKLIPQSDAKEGPLSRLTAAGESILGTMGAGVRRAGGRGLAAAVGRRAGRSGVGRACCRRFEPAAARPGAPAAAPTYNITIHQQPGEDAQALVERVIEAIEERRGVDARGRLYDG